MKSYFILITFVIFLTGCAGVGISTNSYTSPIVKEIKNEKIVNESFDIIWDRAVANLASSFFVINNIDKQSRLINLSYSSDSPEKYIDCGESIRTFSFKNNKETYTYNVAENSFYKLAGTWGVYKNLPSVSEVNRVTSLEGRINVYMAPVDRNKTRITANVRYIISISASGIANGYNGFGNLQLQEKLPSNDKTVISFNTKKTGSKGLLEKQLLDMSE